MSSKNRNENYKRLRKVGFNSYEANRFKDLKPSKVERLIQLRLEEDKKIKEVLNNG